MLLQTKKSVAAHQSAPALDDGPSAAEEAAHAEQEQAEQATAPAAGAAVEGPVADVRKALAAAAEASTSGSRQKGSQRASKAGAKKGGKTGASKGQAAAMTEAPSAEGLPASSAPERGIHRIAGAEPGQNKGEPADSVAPATAADGQAEVHRPAKRATAKSGTHTMTGPAESCKLNESAVDEAATTAVPGQEEAAGPAAAVAAASTGTVEQQEAAAGSEPGAGKPEVRSAMDAPICVLLSVTAMRYTL